MLELTGIASRCCYPVGNWNKTHLSQLLGQSFYCLHILGAPWHTSPAKVSWGCWSARAP